MLEPVWKRTKGYNLLDPYQSIQTIEDGNLTMAALRSLFPDGQANAMNLAMFSTGGTFGTFATIEDVEAEIKQNGFTFDGLTFVVVQPRVLCLRYGRAYPENEDDFAFLKKLRATSNEVFSKIGQP